MEARARTPGERRGDGKGGARHAGRGRQTLQARREAKEADRERRRQEEGKRQERAGPADLQLDVPALELESLHIEVEELDAHVALKADVLDFVKLNVGVDVHLGRVKLDARGVESEVMLKARLDHVTAIVDRLMTALDRNPELVEGLGRAVLDAAAPAGEPVGDIGEPVSDIGEPVHEVAEGAGKAAGPEHERPNGAPTDGGGSGGVAKEVARRVAREVGQAASDEAKDLGLAAARKVREMGERREQRRAGKYRATEGALRIADELGIDLAELEGSGSHGRITIKDVRAQQG